MRNFNQAIREGSKFGQITHDLFYDGTGIDAKSKDFFKLRKSSQNVNQVKGLSVRPFSRASN